MKTFLKIIAGIISFLLILLVVLMTTVIWAARNPQQAWDFSQKHFFPTDLEISWQDIRFDGLNVGLSKFSVDWEIKGLSIKKIKPTIDVPVDLVHLKSTLLPFDSGPKLIVHFLEVRAPQTLTFVPTPSQTKEPEQNLFQQVSSYIRLVKKVQGWVKLEVVDVQVADLKIGDASPLKMATSLRQSPETPDNLILKYKLGIPGESPMQVTVDANLRSQPLTLKAEIEFVGAGVTTKQQLTLRAEGEEQFLHSTGGIQYQKDKLKIFVQPKLDLHLTESMSQLTLVADAQGLPGPLVKINDVHLTLNTPLEKGIFWSEKPSDYKIHGPIELFFVDKKMRPSLEASCECKIPEALKLDADGKIWLATLMAKPKEKKNLLDANLKIESVKNKLLSVDIAATIHLDKQGEQITYLPSLDSKATLHSFQGMRKFLDAKNVLIPAPLNVMEGTIHLVANGPVTQSPDGHQFAIVVDTNIGAKNQRIEIRLENGITLATDFKSATADVKAKIQSLQLDLPPLDPLKGNPRVTSDKRIKLTPPLTAKAQASKFRFTLNLEIATNSPGAIKLFAPYFRPYLPISIDIHRDGNDNKGFLALEPFEIEYLRRKMQVEKMHLNFDRSEEGIIPIDGRFKIQQTNYAVFIEVKGTTTKPIIKLSSDPYLPEKEIYSVLLYDRLSEELIAADAGTAGGVQAAVADRAIGLFGIWAFAATPIKSFSYNPVTKQYTATVALTGDVTAGIGTDWENGANLALRKRVSRQWMLTAQVTPATQSREQRTELVLQWEKRF